MTWPGLDRSGPGAYVHLIRSDTDPKRLSREEHRALREKEGRSPATAWRRDLSILPQSVDRWRQVIGVLLEDGEPRTFNRLCLELTEFAYTGDVCFRKGPDIALWRMVDASLVEHSIEAPVLFRLICPLCKGTRHDPPRCTFTYRDAACRYYGSFEPGTDCDKTLDACQRRGNEERFGGHPHLPGASTAVCPNCKEWNR